MGMLMVPFVLFRWMRKNMDYGVDLYSSDEYGWVDLRISACLARLKAGHASDLALRNEVWKYKYKARFLLHLLRDGG